MKEHITPTPERAFKEAIRLRVEQHNISSALNLTDDLDRIKRLQNQWGELDLRIKRLMEIAAPILPSFNYDGDVS